jgi:hypothetical protein
MWPGHLVWPLWQSYDKIRAVELRHDQDMFGLGGGGTVAVTPGRPTYGWR